MLPISPLAFVAGAATWSFAEYMLHRHVGHGKRAKERKSKDAALNPLSGDFGREHLAHHADTRYFTPTPRKVKAAALALGGMGAVGSLAFGPRLALSYVAGFGATYAFYEREHRRTHTHAPRNGYEYHTRRHHLHHHFGSPKMNHGVTSPIWDMVFGTYEEPDVIKVPRRHAPDWLLDDEGEVKPEYARHYRVQGKKVQQTHPAVAA